MSNLAELAKVVVSLFPAQETASGFEIQTHRVETTEDPKRPGDLDVVIVQLFPPPTDPERPGRYAITLRPTDTVMQCLPVAATDCAMAQVLAMRLRAALECADFGPVTCARDEASKLPAHQFALVAPKPEAPVAVEAKPKRAKDSTPTAEASL